MAKLFDYFLCDQATIGAWGDSVELGDEETRWRIEAAMPSRCCIRHVGPDGFERLAGLVTGYRFEFGDGFDLVRAISDETGPWIMSFTRTVVDALAQAPIDAGLIERWAEAAAEFHASPVERWRAVLTADAAESLQAFCTLARSHEELGVYVCFYG